MTATAHALVAGAIASKFSDPSTATLLAITSHFVLDSVPHWDFGTNWRNRSKHSTGLYATLETIFGMGLAVWFFHSSVPYSLLLITIIASLLPDWLETPWYIFFANQKKLKPSTHAGVLEKVAFGFYKIPNIFHSKAQLPLGLVTQVAAVAFFIFLLG